METIKKLKIFGKDVSINYENETVSVPKNITEDELENIAYYLVEEGFIKEQIDNTQT